MVLHCFYCIACYIFCYLMILHDIAWYCIVWFGILCYIYCMLLRFSLCHAGCVSQDAFSLNRCDRFEWILVLPPSKWKYLWWYFFTVSIWKWWRWSGNAIQREGSSKALSPAMTSSPRLSKRWVGVQSSLSNIIDNLYKNSPEPGDWHGIGAVWSILSRFCQATADEKVRGRDKKISEKVW